MSREVRRVPLDFDWPIDEVWSGYLMPDRFNENECPDCANGATDALEWLQAVAYCIAGLADDHMAEANGRPMHPYITPLRDISYNSAKGRPGPQFAEFANGIAPEARPSFLGRDTYRVQRALIAAAGLPDDWGTCPTCQGHSSLEKYPGQRAEAEAWEPTEPPTGDGWQLWETVSEGSPVTPVFTTADELVDHLATVGQSHGGPMRRAAAETLVRTGGSFGSAVMIGGEFLRSDQDADIIEQRLRS